MAGDADLAALREREARKQRRRRAILTILQPEAKRVIVEVIEWLVVAGSLDNDDRATTRIEQFAGVDPAWLTVTGADRLPLLPTPRLVFPSDRTVLVRVVLFKITWPN